MLVQARNLFPGMGGAILSGQLVVTAFRKNYSVAEGSGMRLFLKHLVLKKLDDYFSRIEVYNFPHIARPLGHEGSSYFYEWVDGTDSFSWKPDGELFDLAEWHEFTTSFGNAGIPVNLNITTPDNGFIAQNIVNQLCKSAHYLNRFWKRIDFGECSLHIDYDLLGKFITDKKDKLEAVLGVERNKLVQHSFKCLTENMSKKEMTALNNLVKRYRLSTLRHHGPKIVIV